MKRLLIIILIVLSAVSTKAAIATWSAYPCYGEIQDVVDAGSKVYVLASGSLYSYDRKEWSVDTYSKATVLTDCDIQYIGYSNTCKKLVIVYTNQNIDLLSDNGKVENLSDYHHKSMTVDKSINSLDVYGDDAYLSTNFGIIKINVRKVEITATYNLEKRVAWVRMDGDKIYAESEYYACMEPTPGTNWMDKDNWKTVLNYTPKDLTVTPELKEEAEKYKPEGPEYNMFGNLKFNNGRLYTVSGFNPGVGDPGVARIQILNNDGTWTNISNSELAETTGHVFAYSCAIAIDPFDKNHYFIGSQTGLYEFKNDVMTHHYNIDNSMLLHHYKHANPRYVYVTALVYDKEGVLWVWNAKTKGNSLLSLDRNGEWKSHHHDCYNYNSDDGPYSYEKVTEGMIDSHGCFWGVNNHWAGDGVAYYDIKNDEAFYVRDFTNEDNIEVATQYERDVAEDRNGDIWIATEGGPLLFLREDIERRNYVFQQIKVPRNDGTNYADYLLSGMDITAVAIDGGNRKWFGTANSGIYVISDDCMTEEYHFTKDNSPLLDNQINDIVIDNKTGEVYIATPSGLCSYASDATETADTFESGNVYAYPNPVTPDYTGLITIVGLTYNSDVKIVAANGALIAEGRSNGGTFTWNGLDRNGNRVASGVYTALITNAEVSEKTSCKIAVVR